MTPRRLAAIDAGKRWCWQQPTQLVEFTFRGQPGALLTIEPATDWPEYLARGWQDRVTASTTGRCPCGATMPGGAPRRGVVTRRSMVHESDCLVPDEAFYYAIGRWIERSAAA